MFIFLSSLWRVVCPHYMLSPISLHPHENDDSHSDAEINLIRGRRNNASKVIVFAWFHCVVKVAPLMISNSIACERITRAPISPSIRTLIRGESDIKFILTMRRMQGEKSNSGSEEYHHSLRHVEDYTAGSWFGGRRNGRNTAEQKYRQRKVPDAMFIWR